MPIQIEQKMPRCFRCGKLVHVRAAERIVEAGALFCSKVCRHEYVELKAENGQSTGTVKGDLGGGTGR